MAWIEQKKTVCNTDPVHHTMKNSRSGRYSGRHLTQGSWWDAFCDGFFLYNTCTYHKCCFCCCFFCPQTVSSAYLGEQLWPFLHDFIYFYFSEVNEEQIYLEEGDRVFILFYFFALHGPKKNHSMPSRILRRSCFDPMLTVCAMVISKQRSYSLWPLRSSKKKKPMSVST